MVEGVLESAGCGATRSLYPKAKQSKEKEREAEKKKNPSRGKAKKERERESEKSDHCLPPKTPNIGGPLGAGGLETPLTPEGRRRKEKERQR